MKQPQKNKIMKTNFIKHTIWAILLVLLVSVSCNKENNPPVGWVRATFTGVDYKMCVCCGGYYFTANDTNYRALEVVKNSVLDEHIRFPKDYFIKFEIPSDVCYGGGNSPVVKITAIENVK